MPMEEASSFSMAGSETIFLQGFNLPGQFGNDLRKALSENALAKAYEALQAAVLDMGKSIGSSAAGGCHSSGTCGSA